MAAEVTQSYLNSVIEKIFALEMWSLVTGPVTILSNSTC